MLTLRNISFSVADRTLFQQVNWTIKPGHRVALVGPNGTGKTTLLRIMASQLEPDSGEVIRSRSYRIGYLPQETIAEKEGTLMESVMTGRSDILETAAQLEALRKDPPREKTRHDQWLKRIEKLEARFSSDNGYDLENRARRILSGLGFTRSGENQPLADFSGGWRMRALLARLLLSEPDLLLLDEPTNHLDLPAMEWLERYLLGFGGSMVIVSHDRFFIDRLAREIVALENTCLTHYPGRYRTFLEMREQQREQARQALLQQKTARQRQEKFIERFRYKASKAAQVQSRIKQLEKNSIPGPPPAAEVKIDFRLVPERSSYRDVLSLRDVGFAYTPGQWVLRGACLELKRKDKICLVGPNGAGKTTLTRLISAELTPTEGSIALGPNTAIGYFAQHQVDTLHLDYKVIDEISASTPVSRTPQVRSVLGLFGFHGDDVFKPIRVLSGGEKARVSLARILLSGSNFLIMDEPTNHLDASARDALEKALRAYEGTVILVSHDRYFLDGIVNRVVEIRDGMLMDYPGNYSDYLEKREEPPTQKPVSAGGEVGRNRKQERQREALARQAVTKERNRLTQLIRRLEDRIEVLEKRRGELETQLSQPETYASSNKVVACQKEHARLLKELESAVSEWETAHLQLEALLSGLAEALSARGDP